MKPGRLLIDATGRAQARRATRQRPDARVPAQAAAPRANKPFHKLAAGMAAAALLTVSGAVLVTVRVSQVQLGYDIAKLERQKKSLDSEIRALRIERQMLAAPERLGEQARTLGLAAPTPAQVWLVDSRVNQTAPRGGTP